MICSRSYGYLSKTRWCPRIPRWTRPIHKLALNSSPARLDYEHMHLALEIPEPVLRARIQTLFRVEQALQDAFGRQYTVAFFGSSRYQVSSAESDLDMVIKDPLRVEGFPPGSSTRLPGIYKVNGIARVLRKAGFINIQPIRRAKVPIVKFKDPRTQMQCDINVNELLGLRNSDLVKQYCELVPLLRPMLGFVKYWAKPIGLNNPSKSGEQVTFSSYAFALMTIGFLQMRGLLPNLQDNLPEQLSGHSRGVFWPQSHPGVRCDTRFGNGEGWLEPSRPGFVDLMRDWFQYWGHVHKYGRDAVCIRKGGIIPHPGDVAEKHKASAKKHRPHPTSQDSTLLSNQDGTCVNDDTSPTAEHGQKAAICVLDPFLVEKNVATNVGPKSVAHFRLECSKMAKELVAGVPLSLTMPALARQLEKKGCYKILV